MHHISLRLLTGAALLTTSVFAGCGEERVADSASTPTVAVTTEPPTPTPTPTPTPSPTATASLPTDSVRPGMEVDLERVARTFVRFARGELSVPPSDTPVDVYVGGVLARTIDDQEDRSRWGGLCPEPGGYAGRVCPFSVLDPLRTGEGTTTYRVGHAEHPCAHTSPLSPSGVGATHVVTIVPSPGSCTSWVAVELFVNDVSQVVAVNLVWAEP